jgi:nucleotidyltransferase/DNA polymerase involved in DNA repair
MDGVQVAHSLQAEIREDLGLPSSLGVASNKLVAKIATEVGKASARSNAGVQDLASLGLHGLASYPNAITIVPVGQEAEFLASLPVEMLWGVGPKTASRLAELGVTTIGELARYPVSELKRLFGKNGIELSSHARGLDDSPIVTQFEIKSVSQEITFAHDIRSQEVLLQTLLKLSSQVSHRLRESGLQGATVKIKIRWPDFTTLTRQVTLTQSTDRERDIYNASLQLFSQVWTEGRAVRLLGVGVSGLGPVIRQLSLWDETYEREHRLNAAIDSLWDKFGPGIIQRGGVKSS